MLCLNCVLRCTNRNLLPLLTSTRTLALWCVRDGMDLHSLRLLMGQSSLPVLQRYLALPGEETERAHKLRSPVDNLSQSCRPKKKRAIL